MTIQEIIVKRRDKERVFLEDDLDFIKKEILSRKPIILKSLLSQEEAYNIRKFSFNRAQNEKENLPKIVYGTPNFHCINNNVEKSKVKKILHVYAYFYWNPQSNPIATYFRRMFKLRNSLSDLPENFALTGIQEGYVSLPVVQQYPRGGGYLQEHTDPDTKQKIVINTILSKFGEDYKDGGLFFRNANGTKIFVDSLLEPGDAFLFHPQTSHGVQAIEPYEKLDWKRSDGRWMCFSTLVTTSSLNGIDDGTSGQPSSY